MAMQQIQFKKQVTSQKLGFAYSATAQSISLFFIKIILV